MWSRFLVVPAAWLILAHAVSAQTVRGVVVDAGDRPVLGVVVLLVDSASRVAARALTSERGEFQLVAPRAGTYRLRTMRIGFRPTISTPVDLSTGGETTRRLVVTGVAIGLDTVRVAGRDVCRAFADSSAATFAVWEQIRTALTAAELTAGSRLISATTISYERAINPRASRPSERMLRQHAAVATAYVTRAWRSLPPDSLRRLGYVVADRNNMLTYYAPGLDMLLSPIFVEDHCFRLVADRRRPAVLGIAFEPTPDRKRVAEIKGMLWVDRGSSELRQLEFQYVNLLSEQEDEARGAMEFARLRDGSWTVSRWNVRMPVLEQDVRPGGRVEIRVAEIQTVGGELALARRGDDTLWSRPPIAIGGSVMDSVSGSAIAGARVTLAGTSLEGTTDARGRFTMGDVMPGQYDLVVRTASLDSMKTVHRSPVAIIDSATAIDVRVPNARQFAAVLCGPAAAKDAGIVVGGLKLSGGASPLALRGGRVIAEWSGDPADTTRLRRLEVPARADGSFAVCGVPLNTTLTLRAMTDSAEMPEPSVVTIPPGARLARSELTLESTAALALRGAVFVGVVVVDSTKQPLPGAEVTLPELGKSMLTDERGAFRLTGIPAGEHRLSVRRMGYGAADSRVTFTGHETVERRVVLGRAVTLEAMVVSRTALDRHMPDFEDNRRLGLGHFMTREEVSKYEGMKMSSVLQQIPQLGLISTGSRAWPVSHRAKVPLCPGNPPSAACLQSHGFYLPDRADANQGIVVACYSLVYVDGTLMNGFREPTEPFDINTIAPDRVEAVEFYAGPAQTPLKYSRMGSACGVVVIWTRRTP